jgi:hypothetical protein
MNGSIKLAALTAMLASAAVLAQEPAPYEERPPAATQTPADQTPADTQAPSDTAQMPTDTTQRPAETTMPAGDTQWPDFATLDTNGDGALSQDEARSQSLLASRFGEIDGDKNGKLSADEYKKAQDKSKAPNP